MNINRNDNIVLWDVDDTLISFDFVPNCEPFVLEYGTFSQTVYPIEAEIKRLKESKFRGHFVRVHSQGGWDWAHLVINKLGLLEYVDSIETKPKWYHDDLPADAWMQRFYEGPKK